MSINQITSVTTGSTIIMRRGLDEFICEAKEDKEKRGNRNGNMLNAETGDLWQ